MRYTNKTPNVGHDFNFFESSACTGSVCLPVVDENRVDTVISLLEGDRYGIISLVPNRQESLVECARIRLS